MRVCCNSRSLKATYGVADDLYGAVTGNTSLLVATAVVVILAAFVAVVAAAADAIAAAVVVVATSSEWGLAHDSARRC